MNVTTNSDEPRAARVYFIQQGEGGPIKIGTARDPCKRLRQLQTGQPVRLRLLGAIPGGRAEEAELHALFAPLRLEGEWFRPEPILVGFVEVLAAAWAAGAP